MTALEWGEATDVGRRRQNNQDRVLVAERLFAVADGMGGHAGGEVASLTAVEALKAHFSREPSADSLEEAMIEANRAVLERAQGDNGLRNMGTTLAAVALVDEAGDEVFAVANVGDSRVYLLRDGELTQLTDDHSVPQELLRAGQLSQEEAAVDPRRNQLTRVLGMPEIVPDMQSLVPYRGDRLLLCSDGLYNEVPDEQIASVLRRTADPSEAARILVDMANEMGGSDNISIVVVDVVDDGDRAATASAALARSGASGGSASSGRGGGGASLMSADERNATLAGLSTEAADDGSVRRVFEDAQPAEIPVPARRFTLRTLAFLVTLALLLGGALAAVAWYARGSYYVGLDEGQVVLFKGRPGGLLWFEPTIEERFDLTENQVLPSRLDDLRAGKAEPSIPDARAYVRNLAEEGTKLLTPPLPPPATSTTLAVPQSTTVP